MEKIIELLGHLHPLVLHLPIGILVLLVLLEIGNLIARSSSSERWPTLADGTRAFILFCLGASTILSAAFGLMLANGGGYETNLLFDHRMYGLLSALLALILFLVHRQSVLYVIFLTATVVVMVLAGHNGGSLTHGKGYLSGFWNLSALGSEVSKIENRATSLDEVEVFAQVVQPIFQERCVSCHGDSKQKGGLRLDSWDAIFKGGESGEVVVAGDANESLLMQRIWLPESHEDHMPPEGKPQPSLNEIRMLEWWVETSGGPEVFLGETIVPEVITTYVSSLLGIELEKPEPLPEREWVMAEARRLENELGILTQPLHPTEPWLEVNARLRFDAFGDEQLALLQPLAPVVQRLDLGETGVTDEGLKSLRPFNNLQMLKLDRTVISDVGLAALKDLPSLHSLTLFSTSITDAGAKALEDFPALKSVYLWDTQVSNEAAEKLKDKLSDPRLTDQLHEEIEVLKNKIRNTQAEVNLGESVTVVSKPNEPVVEE
jgi:uncharacterized membrane protein